MTMAPSSVFLPTLPGRYYTEPAIFEREKREIFEKQWLYVCRAEDVPAPGRFVRATVGNENVIVVRGRDGELRAFLNVCRHRGSTLCLTDAGDVGRSIRCPYHSWTYRLDGSLMSAPNWRSMEAVDKAGYGLHRVPLAEWHGLVWLNLAENPAPFDEQVWPQLDHRLGGDRAKFARYDLAGLVAGQRVDYTVAANWKIIQENFQECYHCATIHPELVDTLPQFRDLTHLGPNYSVTTPIYQVSTFVRPHARPVESGWDYSRIANPTRTALEECLAALDNGASAVATASGMAACTTVIQALCRAGAHLVMPDNVYGGTWDLVHDVYQRWGLAYTAVDMGDLDAVGATISRHVGMLGTAAAPQEAWLVQRGIKTLPVRCGRSARAASGSPS